MGGDEILPKKELEDLGNLITHLMVQRERAKPVMLLHQTTQDIRRIIKRIITRYYLPLHREEEGRFIGRIIDFLCEVRSSAVEDGLDSEFCDYFVGKIISSFERADKIKQWTPKSPAQEEILSSLPVLDKFDLRLRPFIRLVKAEKTQRI